MFGSRRHRPPAQPLTKETANPNAATAAASAFMRRDPAPASLSSAAAAAALRARPTTPTNVAEVQSKRAGRRSASVSSTASRGRPSSSKSNVELRRSPSTGSMTQRTFRSPSPGRSPAPRQRHVPPVPSLPNQDQLRSAPHKKSASLQTQPFRTASQKMANGRASWFGAATGDPSNVRTSDAVLQQTPDASYDRGGSISPSINFSYPRASIESPTPSSRPSSIADQSLVFDANSRRMVPREELLGVSGQVQEASEKPVKKKKHGVSRSGSHLSKGTIGRTKTTVDTSQEPATSVRQPAVTTTNQEPPQDSLGAKVAASELPVVEDKASMQREETATLPSETLELHGSHAATVLPPTESPHVLSLEETDLDTAQEAAGAVPKKLTATLAPQQVTNAAVTGRTSSRSPGADEKRPGSVRRARERLHSESPARTAHFATATDQLVVKHEPPPRSLSPRKSALKRASPRSQSPADDSSEASGANAAPAMREDLSTPRKKANRVSFIEETTVVGEAAQPPPETDSPMIPSPQATKKTWQGLLGRHGKRETTPLDEDETMTPRPALPLFGSVREKKAKEPEERPLVRPSERLRSPPPPDAAPVDEPEDDETEEADLGQSSDHAIGAILANDQSSRHEANISKYREPLPPVVTSIEGPGYISHSATSSESEMDEETEAAQVEDAGQQTPPTELVISEPPEDDVERHVQTEDTSQTPKVKEPEPVSPDATPKCTATTQIAGLDPLTAQESLPMISISEPSPRAGDPLTDERRASRKEYFGIPGGFPDESDSASSSSPTTATAPKELGSVASDKPAGPQTKAQQQAAKLAPIKTSPAIVNAIEPPSSSSSPKMDKIMEEPSTADSEVFSDAYEDLSEAEGDGFMSLDAVLTTPIGAKVTQKMYDDALSTAIGPKEAEAVVQNTQDAEASKGTDDWEHAKSYWKSLTAEKRRQLELEAMEEAGEEADLEESTNQLKKKAKTKKKRDQSGLGEPEASLQRHPDRTYQIEPGTRWAEDEVSSPPTQLKHGTATGSGMRQSMRGAQATGPANNTGQPSMRSSLRSAPTTQKDAGQGMRKSMRLNEQTSATRTGRENDAAARPVSYHPATTLAAAKTHRRTFSDDNVPTRATMQSTLRRRGSDSSESSFRRARPGTSDGTAFRRTMRSTRAAEASQEPIPKGSGRFSLRSLSPPVSPFRRNSQATPPLPPPPAMGSRMMRQSMRNDGASSDGSKSGVRMPSFRRSTKKTKPLGGKSTGSRFDDSSDEDEGRPAFMSRFADSSDEDEAHVAQPQGAGMPRTMRRNAPGPSAANVAQRLPMSRMRSGSPGLPDSDDEIIQPKRVSAAPNHIKKSDLQRSGSGRGTLVSPGSPGVIGTDSIGAGRPLQTRRGSFMSSILRRKRDTDSKISRDIGESAARRDTKLERSTEQLSVIRTGSYNNNRLHKRGQTPSWPLPDGEANGNDGAEDDAVVNGPVDEDKRPSTAGGTAVGARPRGAVLKRRSTSQGVVGLDRSTTEFPEPHKKKKFGTLRKMFGLHD